MVEQQNNIKLSHENVTPRAVLAHILLSYLIHVFYSLPLTRRSSVKAGFLKSHHCYEIVFTVPDVPTLGKELSCLPSSSPSRRSPSLRVQRINSTLEGKYRCTGILQDMLAHMSNLQCCGADCCCTEQVTMVG